MANKFKVGDKVLLKSLKASKEFGIVPEMKKALAEKLTLTVEYVNGPQEVFCSIDGISGEASYSYANADLELKPKYKPIKKTEVSAGVKHDTGKSRMELLPAEGLDDIAKVFAFGANKYGDYNWRKGIGTTRLAGALLRHVFAYLRGETNDPESGLPHMAHAGCNVMMILTTMKNRPDLDDRYKELK